VSIDRKWWIPVLLVGAAVARVAGVAAAPQSAATGSGAIPAQPIPPGYNFPTARPVIDHWVATDNVTAMRNHAWDLWGGMSAPSKSVYQGQRLPIWETWYSNDEVFSSSTSLTATPRIKPHHPLAQPRQFKHAQPEGAAAAAAAGGEQVVAFNKFDPTSATFLKTSHPTPPGSKTSYQYTSASSLTNLNNAWPTGTPVVQRKIVDFPDRAIDTKPVLWPIKATGLSPFPFWQGPSDSTDPANPSPTTWKTCILIDPLSKATGLRKATEADIKKQVQAQGLACQKYPFVAPITMLYHFKVDAEEAAAFNNAQPYAPIAAGDYAVLAAMHVTTKEIKNWTWQTFWWQAGQNPPNNFPGSNAGLNAKVKGLWRNYAMCTAYMMVTQGPKPGQPVVCFNPFLETSKSISDGINSNCMSCHGTARYPSNNNPFYPVKYPYVVNFNDPQLFGTQTQTDFAWAIQGNAQ
jgi:hypothetical protein